MGVKPDTQVFMLIPFVPIFVIFEWPKKLYDIFKAEKQVVLWTYLGFKGHNCK